MDAPMRLANRGTALLASVWLAFAASPALAHPHVFIDTGLEVIFDDQGNATALRISWTYDEYFSLVIAEEHGIDPDYDGNATVEEAKPLAGFDMSWDAGYPGDTYALMNDAELALSRPNDWTASYAGGKITSSHVRTFEAPVKVADVPLIVQVYDPSFYTAYAIVGTPVLTGGDGCSVEVFEPDVAAADAQLQAAIDEMAGSTDVEGEFPAIGKAYSEEARVTCAAPS
jgi:ABC-type uncharacterized transport system substrate-binding protein